MYGINDTHSNEPKVVHGPLYANLYDNIQMQVLRLSNNCGGFLIVLHVVTVLLEYITEFSISVSCCVKFFSGRRGWNCNLKPLKIFTEQFQKL